MKKGKRMLAILLGICMLAAALTACQSKEPAAGEKEGAAAEKQEDVTEKQEVESIAESEESIGVTDKERPSGKLTVLVGDFNGDGGETSPVKIICKEYAKVNPNVEFEYIACDSNSYGDKLMTMMAAGEANDLVMLNTNSLYLSMIDNGYIEPLDSYIEGSRMELEEFFGNQAELLRYEGSLYALPLTKNEYLVYYNKNMFDELGAAYPTNDMTWEEYAEICQKMTNGSGADKVYGGFFQNWKEHYSNITICDGKHTICDYDDYAWMKPGLNLLLDLQENGNIMDYATVTANNLRFDSVFINQQAATVYTGTWFLGMLASYAENDMLDFEYGIVKAPYLGETGKQGDNTVSTIELCINSDCANKELAWDVLNYASTSEECSKAIAAAGWIPTHITQEARGTIEKLTAFPEDGMDAFCSTDYYLEIPLDQNLVEIDSLVSDLISMTFTKSATVDEAIGHFAEDVGKLK